MMVHGTYRHGQDLDEYEDDDDDEVPMEDEYEEENAEEEPQLTTEQIEYLDMRQKLKEIERRKLRQQLKKENGLVLASSSAKKKTPLNDNFGSFFGPSQPVIAKRVIEEARAKLEMQHMTLSLQKSSAQVQKKSSHSAQSSHSKSNGHVRPRKVFDQTQLKVQKLKEARDYSFLSEDADPPREDSLPRARADPTDTPQRETPSNGRSLATKSSKPGSVVPGKLPLVNRQLHSKAGMQKEVASFRAKPGVDPKKVPSSNMATGPGWPGVTKAVVQKSSGSVIDRKQVSVIPKLINGAAPRPPIQKQQQVVQNRLQQKPIQPSNSLARAAPSKPQIQKPRPSSQGVSQSMKREKPKKDDYSDEEYSDDGGVDIRSMIRQITGYDPSRYRDRDDDDRDMEVGFNHIQAEERRSARIACEEDERELALIEAEERRERQRKKSR